MLKKIISKIKRLTGLTKSKAWHIYSDEYAGENLSVCYIGSEIQKNFIKRALFPKAACDRFLGPKIFYKLNPLFTSKKFDLTIAEKFSETHQPSIDQLHWEIPFWIHSYTDIPLTKLNNSFKSDLRLIRKNNLSYRVTTNADEITEFYNNMYLPLVNQRHGESSIHMELEELINAVASKQAELVLVLHENEPISGMAIDYRGSLPNLWSVGVLDAQRELVVMGAIPASYHFSYIHLQNFGYSRVSLGLCRSFIEDGILKFKRKFGLKILNATDRTFVFIPNKVSKAMKEMLRQNAFIHRKNGKLGLATFIEESGEAEQTQANFQKRFAELELCSSKVYTVSDQNIELTSDIEFSQLQSLNKQLTREQKSEQEENTASALYLLRHLINQRNEKLMLLYGDELSDSECMNVIEATANSLGVEVERLNLTADQTISEQSEQIESCLRTRKFDLICEASGQYFYNTPSWRLAREMGVRSFGLGPLDLESLRNCVGKVDHHKVFFLAERIENLIKNANSLLLTDKNGTELYITYKRPLLNQVLSKLKLATPYYSAVQRPTGFLANNVNWTFLGGQLSFLGYPPGINGRVVIDSFLWPPKQLGSIKGKVTLQIKEGVITDISGGEEASVFSQHQPETERNLEHICLGLNPGANIEKNLMEAERALGACNFGFGKYPYHTDGVISKPTLLADGLAIIENGVINKSL